MWGWVEWWVGCLTLLHLAFYKKHQVRSNEAKCNETMHTNEVPAYRGCWTSLYQMGQLHAGFAEPRLWYIKLKVGMWIAIVRCYSSIGTPTIWKVCCMHLNWGQKWKRSTDGLVNVLVVDYAMHQLYMHIPYPKANSCISLLLGPSAGWSWVVVGHDLNIVTSHWINHVITNHCQNETPLGNCNIDEQSLSSNHDVSQEQ